MRNYFFILLLFRPFQLLAQPLSVSVETISPVLASTNDSIYYRSTDKLIWNNFKAAPDKGGLTAALTSSGFGYDAGMLYKNGSGTLNINTYCFFDKSKSWVKPNQRTDYILDHEQHHFDISCIGMQIFIQRLKQTRFTVQNYSSMLDKLYNESYEAMTRLQNEYDNETKNGQLKNKQAEWIKKIDQQLAGLLK